MKTGIIEVFSRCVTCGVAGARVRSIEKYCKKNGIMFAAHKTGDFRTPLANLLHEQYLAKIEKPISYRIGIVVENGNKVSLLSEWQPSS